MKGHYNLARSHVLVRGTPKRISECLRVLGVGFKNGPSFWHANAEELEWILKDAKQAWREESKSAHTDHGGTHEGATVLNQIWERTRSLFRSRGVTLDERKVVVEKRVHTYSSRPRLSESEKLERERTRVRNWHRAKKGIPLDWPVIPKGERHLKPWLLHTS